MLFSDAKLEKTAEKMKKRMGYLRDDSLLWNVNITFVYQNFVIRILLTNFVAKFQ